MFANVSHHAAAASVAAAAAVAHGGARHRLCTDLCCFCCCCCSHCQTAAVTDAAAAAWWDTFANTIPVFLLKTIFYNSRWISQSIKCKAHFDWWPGQLEELDQEWPPTLWGDKISPGFICPVDEKLKWKKILPDFCTFSTMTHVCCPWLYKPYAIWYKVRGIVWVAYNSVLSFLIRFTHTAGSSRSTFQI